MNYHEDFSRYSRTMLEAFRMSRPLFKMRYIDKDGLRIDDTPALAMGKALHCAILTPRLWADNVAVMPDVDRRTTQGKKDWKDFCATAVGKIHVTEDQAKSVESMADSLMANDEAARLLKGCVMKEYVIHFDDEDTKLPLKLMFDGMTQDGDVVDIKSTSDPSPEGFAKSVARFGYHRQQAFYTWGINDRKPLAIPCRSFTFLVVQNEAPFETAVYTLNPADVALGLDQLRLTLGELSDCIHFNSWGSRHTGVREISLPTWARREEEKYLEPDTD